MSTRNSNAETKRAHPRQKITVTPQSGTTSMERHSLIEEAGHLWTHLSGGVAADCIQDLRVGFVSTFAGEGTTTMAANFARFMARKGVDTAIVEGNLRRPGMAREFRVPTGAGLWDLIEQTAKFREAARRADGLTLMAAGNVPHNFSSDFGDLDYRHVHKVVDFLQRHHAITVVDVPPLSSAPEAGPILKNLHRAILVVRAGETKKADVKRSLATLKSLGIPCAGIALNDMRYELPAGLARVL